MGRVEEGYVGGLVPSDAEGRPLAGEGPQRVDPASRFGLPQGGKLTAADDLKGSHANRAAAVRTPVNLPTWGQFEAATRYFQQGRGGPTHVLKSLKQIAVRRENGIQ